VPNTAATSPCENAPSSTRAASGCTTTSASTNQSTSPEATDAPWLRAPPGPSLPPEGIVFAPPCDATHAEASVEPSSTTMTSAISRSRSIRLSGSRQLASTRSPL